MIDIPTTITTAAQTYTPPSGSIVLPSKTYFGQRGEYEPVPLVQYDDTLPIIAAALYLNGQPYTVPDGAAVNIRMAKGDGTYVYNPALGVSEDRQTAYIAVTYQMTVIAGNYRPILELVVSGDVAGTSELPLQIAENPVPEDAIASTDEYKTIQQLAAEVTVAAQIVTENEAAIQAISENLTAIKNAPTAAANAAASATLAESWAVGGTGTRPGENTNNAQYYAQLAQQVSQGALGWYATPQALQSAHPTGQNGQWAIVGSTDTIWTWDSDTSAWVNSGAQVDLSNYYTKEQADARYLPQSFCPYDVGDILTTSKAGNPSQRWPGTSWEQLKDRFMLGAGDTYTAGAMGGEANVALSQDNIPRMTTSSANKSYATTRVMGQAGSGTNTTSTRSAAAEAPTGGASWEFVNISWNSNHSHTVGGNGTAHNNMPPYLVVYIWKRTA